MSGFPDANIVRVDLNNGVISKEILPGSIYRLYPGGSALALYLILKNIEVGIDPLSADNVLVFAVSPLTGLPVAGLSRIVAAAKSPLTGAIGDSQAGGNLPVELKSNGIDALLFTGRSERPVYLYIKDGEVSLRDAAHLWGKITGDVQEILEEEHGSEIEIAQIGPAGENLVRYACVIHDCCRANGRTGNGAVMGSKKLKAIVVGRTGKPAPVDADGLKAINRDLGKKLSDPFWQGFKANGTAANVEGFQAVGYLPSRNFSEGYLKDAEKVGGKAMADSVLIGNDNCFACPVRCKRVVEIPGLVSPRYGGPEYETIGTVGTYCGITSMESVCVSNQLCNMYGVDTISCGATISFAMECYENGVISADDTDGIELNYGNSDAVHALIEKISSRVGFGDVLAEGSKIAAEQLGRGAERFVLTVKGLEFPAHMPQLKPALGLVYAVNPFGADHQSSEHDTVLTTPAGSKIQTWLGLLGLSREYKSPLTLDSFKVRFALHSQYFYSLLDTLCMCQFVWGPSWQLFGPDDILTLCRCGIGWETSIFELMQIGERRLNMMRYFNAREGFTKADDKLPERFFNEPFSEGPAKGAVMNREEFEAARELYYGFAGWDKETGNPTVEKLEMLSLDWISSRSLGGDCQKKHLFFDQSV